jgi:hypothetical protein
MKAISDYLKGCFTECECVCCGKKGVAAGMLWVIEEEICGSSGPFCDDKCLTKWIDKEESDGRKR